MKEEKITYEELEQALKDIEESISSWRFYIKNGADLGSFCNEVDNLRACTEYFLKKINDFADQCALEEMENIKANMF